MPAGSSHALHVEDSGEGSPVVLVHSSGLSGRQWRRASSELLGRGHRVIVPDLAGHGRSAPWPEPTPFTFRVDVEHITALLEGIAEPTHLVGHSYGGLVALLAAALAPSRVRSIALYDPVAFGTLDRPTDVEARGELEGVRVAWEATAEGRVRWLEAFVDYWGGRGAWAALRGDARAEFVRVAWVVYQGVISLVDDRTPASTYGAIGRPVLLVTGEHTPRAARRVVERLGESIEGARTVIVPGAGHMGPLTHADVVAKTIAQFVESIR